MNEYKCVINSISQPSQNLLVLELADHRGRPLFKFKTGQYVMISFRNRKGVMEEKHTFSIASSPTDQQSLTLGIRISGRFTQELATMKQGDAVYVYGPYGSFVFDQADHPETVFLAGGIGITPFLSALRYAREMRLPNKFWLIHSNRTLAATPFYDELRGLAAENPNFNALFAVTDDQSASQNKNLLNKKVNLDTIKSFVGTPAGKTFFLCGPKPFMDAMSKALLAFGAAKDQIMMEEFAMMSSGELWPRLRHALVIVGFSLLAILLPFYLLYASSIKTDSVSSFLDRVISEDPRNVQNESAAASIPTVATSSALSVPATASGAAEPASPAEVPSAAEPAIIKNPAPLPVKVPATRVVPQVKPTAPAAQTAPIIDDSEMDRRSDDSNDEFERNEPEEERENEFEDD